VPFARSEQCPASLQSPQPQHSRESVRLEVDVRGVGAAGPGATVSITAPHGSRLADVLADVIDAGGVGPGAVRVDGTSVPPDAVLGLPPLLHGALLEVGGPALRQDPSEPAAVVELRVLSGPDAGAVHGLPAGSYRVGRSGDDDVSIDDPEISRHHVRLHVGGPPRHVVTLADAGSTNGVTVGRRQVDADAVVVGADDVVRVGRTTLRVSPVHRSQVVRRCDGSGLVLVNRPPRARTARPQEVVSLPAPPVPTPAGRLPIAALAVPLVVGIAMALVTGTATYLLFVLLAPLMLLGSWLNDRVGARRVHRADVAAHRRADDAAQVAVAAALRREHEWCHTAFPDLAELLGSALGHRQGLWHRRPADDEFLVLRVGLGEVVARLRVSREQAGSAGGGPDVSPAKTITDAPVTVSLADAGVLGLAGPTAQLDGLARALVAQVTGWHSPRDVDLVVLAPGHEWRWTRWLPHVRRGAACATGDVRVATTPDEVRALVEELLIELAARPDLPGRTRRRTVVLAVGAETLRSAGGARLLADGPAAGTYLICCDRTVSALPLECTATVEVVDSSSAFVSVGDVDATTTDDVVLDGVSARLAETFARALAPLRDASPHERSDGLPTDVRLLDLLQIDPTDPTAVSIAWDRRPRSTRVPIGVGPAGEPVVLDLAANGPHLLIAGTTGSGKSELLQTLVASLATVNRPDELVFVLVDYKGGAAFRGCAELPHTVGMVTDLDGHLTERALRSLDAELRRRERVLGDVGASDIESYVRHEPGWAVPGRPPLPRLVIVVDEFATLVDELPDFVSGLVGIAQRGRSLGVHLVLATQRPAGVVSADIRANTSLRIALRVTDPAESMDVLETGDAARLPHEAPGRAVLRIGGGPVRLVQVARVSGASVRQAQLVEVRRLGRHDQAEDRQAPAAPGRSEVSDLARIVSALRAAARAAAVCAVPSPWLPPLPSVVTVADLGTYGPVGEIGSGVPIGLQDVPAEQLRRPLRFALDGGGHLLVVGAPGSGRTSTLRTIAGQLARQHTSRDLHLHAIDAGGGLARLSCLPQCGTVVGRHQPELAARLLHLLSGELDLRQRLLADAGGGSLEEYRARAAGDRLPFVVLLVDGWEAVRELLESIDDGCPQQLLERLLRDGSGAGLRVVVAGDRGALTGRGCAGVTDRLLLRLADPGDYALAGVGRASVPGAMAAGRALAGREAVETQLALLAGDGSGAAQQAAIEDVAASARRREPVADSRLPGPLRLRPLPSFVPIADLAAAPATTAAGERWAVLGVGGDDARPVRIELCPNSPAVLIAGPPGSGRTNALAVLARWCEGVGRPVLVVAPARSPLRRLRAEGAVQVSAGHDDVGPVTAALARCPDAVVLVDDAELVQGSGVEPALLSVLRGDLPRGRAALVLAGTTVDLAAAFRGVVAEARKGRTGVLLGPHSPVDGELFGLRAPRVREAPPGRGLLVVQGRASPVQVAAASLPPDPVPLSDRILLDGVQAPV
jgi:S-DNA-T family DNA segregation ATPase FtsK/SpoIIIE